jgi:hypothetical protein
MTLAGRPAERTSAHHVQVHVEHELVRVPVDVHRRPPAAVGDPARLRERGRDAEELPRERVVLGREVVQRGDVLARDDEQVDGCLRIDVLERDDVCVLVDDLRGDLLLDDLAE